MSALSFLEVPDAFLSGFSTFYDASLGALCTSIESLLRAQFPADTAAVDNLINTYAPLNPMSERLPLMNPYHAVIIALLYLISLPIMMIVGQVLGKRPYKGLVMFHNVLMVVLSTYMCVEVLRNAFLVLNYNLWGNSVPTSKQPAAWGMAKIIWIFYISKVPEFMDTYIMMLKQNYKQVSFLHVYHHSSIFVIWCFVTRMAPGGESYFSAAMNSFIHVIMYSYYWASSVVPVGSRAQAFLQSNKLFITRAQMLQFFLNLLQATFVQYLMPPSVVYPKALGTLLFWYMLTLLGLFGNFLLQTQKSRKSGREGKASSSGGKKSN